MSPLIHLARKATSITAFPHYIWHLPTAHQICTTTPFNRKSTNTKKTTNLLECFSTFHSCKMSSITYSRTCQYLKLPDAVELVPGGRRTVMGARRGQRRRCPVHEPAVALDAQVVPRRGHRLGGLRPRRGRSRRSSRSRRRSLRPRCWSIACCWTRVLYNKSTWLCYEYKSFRIH